MHLWFLVHGLYGDVSNLKVMQEVLQSIVPDTDRVHIAKSTELLRTFDGIEIGALRLHDELMQLIAESPSTHISIVGYSLGGLYARYLIGLLQKTGFFDSVTPVVFASFASPHLGSTQWSSRSSNWLLNGLGRVLLGVTGSELFCQSSWGLVHTLSKPDLSYYMGLKRFRRRLLFANAVNDRSVHFWTAFITNKVPFAKDHEHTTELAFHSYNDDPEGRFILDLQHSRHLNNEGLPPPKTKSTSIVINLGPPIMGFILLFVSVGSWICYPFLAIKWRTKYRRSKKPPTRKNDDPLSSQEPNSPQNHLELSGEAQTALDALAPKNEEDSVTDSSIIQGPTTSAPQPVPQNQSTFLTSTTKELPFGRVLIQRMTNLNSLSWEKYAVYLEG